jgi:hypothetical protein
MSYYDPFKQRLRGGPAVSTDCVWAIEEAESLLSATSVALTRLGFQGEAQKLIEVLERTRQARERVAVDLAPRVPAPTRRAS